MNAQSPEGYFESIYHETFKRLSQYVYFKSPSYSEAEDVVAAVYTDFYRYIVKKDKRPLNVTAYLIRMANHELSRLYSAKKQELSLDDEDTGLAHTLPADDKDLLQVFDQFEKDELWQAVMRLSQAEQDVIIAKVRFEMNFREIAVQLRQGESAVKLRYYRALKKLADDLGK
ncbi:MAG: sigma-70 family RNA polymerase sigma factor [Eubacteriales bacterium]|nr:sigma-70 family RNA polymerase sigma factor [Eubacteriales bacterium]